MTILMTHLQNVLLLAKAWGPVVTNGRAALGEGADPTSH